jgi:DNA topoisomerase III
VLLYSWADKRNLEYFHNLNFPATEVLASIYQRLGPQSLPKEELRQAMRLDGEVFEKALEKLWLHGGAAVDPEENVSRGKAEWREPYERLREHRLEQLGLTFRFAESHGCRMLHLVHHFGDQEDTGHPCGQCDVCAPDEALAHRFHAPSPQEERRLREILEALAETNGLTVGQLFRALGGEMGDVERKQLDRWLGGLVRAGLVRLAAESWEKEGRTIHFQRAYLTREGLREGPEGAARVQLAEAMRKAGSKKRERTPRPLRATAQAVDSGAAPALVEALRSWRLAEAKRRKVPAFHILTDRTLLAVASHRPEDEPSLLAVPGIGPTLAKKIGPDLLRIVSEH